MPNGNQIARFTYNQRLELVKSVRDRGGCGPNEVHTYAYDLNHNWTQKDGVSYTNNIADQLLAVAGGGSLSYNDSGQATDVQGWDVTYNCADQITSILAPGKNIAYRYDGAGQRVEKTVNGVTQKFLWNGGDICKEYRADGTVRADYFLGAGREGIKTNGQWHWYLSDIQGSTLMLTDATGHSAATYDYTDYGETRQTSGSPALYNPFLYTGQEYDFETSLYHLRARHYSPANGRFFSRDPIGYAGGSNMYAYCTGDPIDFSDPSGLIFVAETKVVAVPHRDFSGLFFETVTSGVGSAQIILQFQAQVLDSLDKWRNLPMYSGKEFAKNFRIPSPIKQLDLGEVCAGSSVDSVAIFSNSDLVDSLLGHPFQKVVFRVDTILLRGGKASISNILAVEFGLSLDPNSGVPILTQSP